MIRFSEFMGDFMSKLEKDETLAGPYKELSRKATEMLHIWCWDQRLGLYTDRVVYEENPTVPFNEEAISIPKSHVKRQLAAFTSNYRANDIFNTHRGILNLYTLGFGLMDKNMTQRIDNALAFAADENEIFSPFGLRGLSARDELYSPNHGYWRGPVWVSVNYLVLRGLNKWYLDYVPEQPLSSKIRDVKELYTAIRKNLLTAVYKSWEVEHLFYENWNDISGKGQFSHPFTGWTTLVLLIFTEKYM
jgi:hypothetical protein